MPYNTSALRQTTILDQWFLLFLFCFSGAFLPFLENCFEEIFKLLNYPQEDIRKAAVTALLQFCLTLNNVNALEGKQALLKALEVSRR